MMRVIVCLILTLATCSVSSQTLGLRPPSTKLRQIDTDTVRVIYTDGQESEAQRVVNLVHYMARKYPFVGSDNLRKISILLQNETDIPNGYVGLAPWLSEFYISPPSGNFQLGSLPWIDLLSIHEFRHVQQRSAARTGLSKFAFILFGEEFFSAIVNISWPNWYTEGDAVIFETALSKQGRGRLPSFLNGYRDKVLGDEDWSYTKARNGSFKDFVPNHYNLGFLMQNYGRTKYGQDFWDKVALESASYKGLIYPFSKAVKRVSGENTTQFYASALDYYRELWGIDTIKGQSVASDPFIDVDHDRYEDYSYPVFDPDGNLYVVIESYDFVPAVYRFDRESHSRKLVTRLGYSGESIVSVAAGKIAWAEYRLNSRWERKDYSSIIVFDEAKKSKRKLTKGESYFSPALSFDGSKIVALHDDDMQNYELHIIDIASGAVVDRLPNPYNYYFSFPTWTSDAKAIVSPVRDSHGQMALFMHIMGEDDWERLTPWSFQPIGRPTLHKDWIYYTKSEEELDQLYRLSVLDGTIEKIAAGAHSRYQPVINPLNGDLVFAEYSNDGRRIRKVGPKSFAPGSVPVIDETPDYLFVEESEDDILSDIPQVRYDTKKYGLFAHPVNIHSWRPVFDDPVYGLELRFLNVLQSLRWNTGIQFNSNSKDYGPFSELTLSMWYPEILFGYTGWKRKRTRESDNHVFNFYDHIADVGLRIPFKGFHGAFNYAGGITTRINQVKRVGDIEDSFTFLSHQFNFVHRLRLAKKHPMTRFGQAVRLTLPHSISGDTASQFQAQTDFTFPSFRNHVVWLQFDYRKESSDNTFLFGDNFMYSRGYAAYISNWIYRIGVNYQLPIAYPDFGFGGLIYFNRVRTNLFADISKLGMESGQLDMNSVGLELIFDVKVLNIESFSFGLRWSYRLQEDPSYTVDPSRSKFGIFVPVNRI